MDRKIDRHTVGLTDRWRENNDKDKQAGLSTANQAASSQAIRQTGGLSGRQASKQTD